MAWAGRMVGSILILAVLLSGGCGALKAITTPPLPPAEVLGLQAQLLPGPASAGQRAVYIGWSPPEGADLVVLEQAESPEGPWQEIKTVKAATGFHQENSFFRPNRFYYFRAILVRGNQETVPSAPVTLWVPSEPPTTPTPMPTRTPTPTPTEAPETLEPSPTPAS